MPRVVTRALILSAAALLSGCGSGAVPPPKAPPKTVETHAQPRQEKEPKLIAPPPAYGNKVVMASVGEAGRTN